LKHSEALEVLYRRGNEVQNLDLGLERITAVMESFGNPHQSYPALHIAGTNGKGSVAAMSESILRHGGWKTGLYTSPHLVNVEERIRVAGINISRQKFAALVSRVTKHEATLLDEGRISRPLTYFEIVTACGFLHFAAERIDAAIVEVGLGGKHDATNILTPAASVLTPISYDHEVLLGNTIARIAGEKAGIIKPGVAVVTGPQLGEARAVLVRRARALNAPLVDVERDCLLKLLDSKGGRCRIDLETPHRKYSGLQLSLAGQHQAVNAAIAVSAVEALRYLPVKPSDVRRGLACTRWPGRLDEYWIRRRTLLDGAHNAGAARILRAYLRDQDVQNVHLVFGALRDKDIERLGRILFPLANTIHLTAIGNSRSARPSEIADLHPRHRSRMQFYERPAAALLGAWAACPPDGLVVVTGSLYLVGELLPAVQREAVTRG
jgi:dihydrofolate synthase/folylpolyglutamate synthase